jgi:hypothetical protein
VAGAARIVDVDRRTVYNYVKKNKVYSVKVAGSTLRICTHCLLRENHDEHTDAHSNFSLAAKSASQT